MDALEEKSSAWRYVAVWGALVCLTAATYAASRVSLGALHLPVALAIALTKSLLVVVFFMHLWQHAPANRLVMGIAIVFLVLLMVLTVGDVATRTDLDGLPPPWFSEQPLPP
jgi:cytochrome c oxidase subunit IV